MSGLLGRDVMARDGRLGALEDLYLDGESWRVRYLVVAPAGDGSDEPLLVSSGCADAAVHAGEPITLELSRAQLEAGGGAWPARAASAWLEDDRVCSGSGLVGFRIDAQDGAAGRLADLLVDEQEWCIDYLVVDSPHAGGRRKMLLPLDWVSALDIGACRVRVQRTLDELRASPRLDTAT